MIALENISKIYRTKKGTKTVLKGISYTFKAGRSTGIIGKSESGKSTLIRIINGSCRPTAGWVRRTVRVSWPLADTSAFHPLLSVAENIQFAARIYGEDSNRLLRLVDSYTNLGSKLNQSFARISTTERSSVSITLCLGIPFDVYLIDELFIRGDRNLKQRYRGLVEQRLEQSDVIVASQKTDLIEDFCQDALMLHDGQLFRLPPVKGTAETFMQLADAEPRD